MWKAKCGGGEWWLSVKKIHPQSAYRPLKWKVKGQRIEKWEQVGIRHVKNRRKYNQMKKLMGFHEFFLNQ